MCAIIGFSLTQPGIVPPQRAISALNRLKVRGPDDAGYACGVSDTKPLSLRQAETRLDGWGLEASPALTSASLFLGHTRYSIVELSRLGAQPMLSEDGAVCVTFNGEIYNHSYLRNELKAFGHRFRSGSDTEVLLHAYLEWGAECFKRFVGWWSVAIHDSRRGGVLLCRDRIGKAPLYTYNSSGGVFWSSEIAALFELLGEDSPRPNWDAVHDFVRHGERDVFGQTTYSSVTTLQAGTYRWVSNGVVGSATTFWSLPTQRAAEGEISVPEAARLVKQALMEATELRMQADVPVALQLSGGLDSSVILACAAEAGKPIHAITASFGQAEFNEDAFARAAAGAFGHLVDHELIKMDQEVSLEEMSAFTNSMGEPFHSPNQMVSRIVWQLLRERGYKAVLYGAGGDEVFAGYYGQYIVPFLRERLLRRDLAGFFDSWWNLSERKRNPADLLGRLAILLPGGTLLFDQLRRSVRQGHAIYTGTSSSKTHARPWRLEPKLAALMCDFRMNYWLRVDNQNSMQVPIELRSPFLDHRVIEAAFSLPTTYLIRDGWMKWIIRKAFETDLPESVIWRRAKMGFPFPLSHWLQQNKTQVQSIFLSSSAPNINIDAVRGHFDYNVSRDPEQTWRALSYAIWWATANMAGNE